MDSLPLHQEITALTTQADRASDIFFNAYEATALHLALLDIDYKLRWLHRVSGRLEDSLKRSFTKEMKLLQSTIEELKRMTPGADSAQTEFAAFTAAAKRLSDLIHYIPATATHTYVSAKDAEHILAQLMAVYQEHPRWFGDGLLLSTAEKSDKLIFTLAKKSALLNKKVAVISIPVPEPEEKISPWEYTVFLASKPVGVEIAAFENFFKSMGFMVKVEKL